MPNLRDLSNEITHLKHVKNILQGQKIQDLRVLKETFERIYEDLRIGGMDPYGIIHGNMFDLKQRVEYGIIDKYEARMDDVQSQLQVARDVLQDHIIRTEWECKEVFGDLWREEYIKIILSL